MQIENAFRRPGPALSNSDTKFLRESREKQFLALYRVCALKFSQDFFPKRFDGHRGPASFLSLHVLLASAGLQSHNPSKKKKTASNDK
jgi:hypothetical protein